MRLKVILNMVLGLATSVIERQLPKLINDPWILSIITSLFLPFKKVLMALTDSDPKNDEQLKAILVQTSPSIIDANMDLFIQFVEPKIGDQDLLNLVLFKIQVFRDLLKLITDENPNNKEQITALISTNGEPALDLSFSAIKMLVEKSKKLPDSAKDIAIPLLDGLIELELLNLQS